MDSFTSVVDWETLKIGPETAQTPQEAEDSSHKVEESPFDL